MATTSGTLVEQVADQLRIGILEGRLAPGARIPQEEIARDNGTSRLPVREALRILHHEGLVTLSPNVGARVASLSLEELEEVYLLRERLEPFSLSASIPLLSEEEIAQLRSYVEEMESIAETGDKAGWFELDRMFHLAGFSAAPLPQLVEIVAGFWNVAQRYRRTYTDLLFPTQLSIQHAEHRLLLNSIERRQGPDAEALLGMHIRRTRLELANHPELFN